MTKEFDDILAEEFGGKEIAAAKQKANAKRANVLESGLALLNGRLMSTFFMTDTAPRAENISFKRVDGAVRGVADIVLLNKKIRVEACFNDIESMDLAGLMNESFLKKFDPRDPEALLVARFLHLITTNGTYRKNVANVIWTAGDQLRAIDELVGGRK